MIRKSIPDCAMLSAGSRALLDGVFDPRIMWPHNPGIFLAGNLIRDWGSDAGEYGTVSNRGVPVNQIAAIIYWGNASKMFAN
jgi:hypothetical protein